MPRRSVESLFEVFSLNLGLYLPEHAGLFACPLCLRLYRREAGCIPDVLSRAHFVPERLGGRHYTLACRECNNRIGTQVESFEVERAKVKLGKPIAATLTLRESDRPLATVRVRMVTGMVGRIEFGVLHKASDPEAVRRLEQRLHEWAAQDAPRGGSAERWFDLRFRARADWQRGALTYLHAAFMYLFHEFGYEYALDTCATAIRAQLRQPCETILPVWIPVIGDATGVEMPAGELSIAVVTNPEVLRGLLVTLPKLEHVSETIAVWVPLFGHHYPTQTDEELFRAKVRVVFLPETHALLVDSNAKWIGHRLVRHCLQMS